ncbi:MAG: DUF3592 domain-containing protein [Verrucomicrobia bacterium]|nr:DUF3592 domain-containing protein [Verrucomicrobiota bacterium]
MSTLLWKILFVVVGSLALWRSATASLGLWEYYRLGPEVSAEIIQWELLPKGSKYAIEATFAYDYRGKNYTTRTVLGKPYHLNRGSAEHYIQKMSGMKWTAWVDADRPHYAALEKNFPLKQTVYAICLVGILLYFIYIRFHLELLARSS